VILSKLGKRRSDREPLCSAAAAAGRQQDWVEIFTDRVSERLKEVLQEDMDWMTSRPILERLNRLHEIERAGPANPEIIRPSDRKPGSSK
jgi:hypothetical protein